MVHEAQTKLDSRPHSARREHVAVHDNRIGQSVRPAHFEVLHKARVRRRVSTVEESSVSQDRRSRANCSDRLAEGDATSNLFTNLRVFFKVHGARHASGQEQHGVFRQVCVIKMQVTHQCDAVRRRDGQGTGSRRQRRRAGKRMRTRFFYGLVVWCRNGNQVSAHSRPIQTIDDRERFHFL